MANNAISMFNMPIDNKAPKTIDEIGARTFVVKERLWAWNTMRNMQYIWCKDHMGYPDLLHIDMGDLGKIIDCEICWRRSQFRLGTLADKHQGKILVVGAGPSFFDNIDKIKRWKGPVIASDRALIPLLEAGVVPQWVVAADGVDHVKDYFIHPLVDKHKKEITAIFNTQIHPLTTQAWGDYDRIMWFNVGLDEMSTTKSITRYLYHMTNDTVISVPWGHVGGYCLGFAVLFGFSEIAIIGMELGFKESDVIEDTPYWNPYYKATCEEMVRKKYNMKDFVIDSDAKVEEFNTKAKALPFDIRKEYTSKTPDEEYNIEAKQSTIKEYFEFYKNPFGKTSYHDKIFKAYKDILFNFITGTPNVKFIQCSENTTWFPIACKLCHGIKDLDERKEVSKTCYKCHVERKDTEFVKKVPCPACRRIVGKNEKGEFLFESTGIMGTNVECIDLDDYINRGLETPK